MCKSMVHVSEIPNSPGIYQIWIGSKVYAQIEHVTTPDADWPYRIKDPEGRIRMEKAEADDVLMELAAYSAVWNVPMHRSVLDYVRKL